MLTVPSGGASRLAPTACVPNCWAWAWPSMNPGINVLPPRSFSTVPSPCCSSASALLPTNVILPSSTTIASTVVGWSPSIVTMGPPVMMRSAAAWGAVSAGFWPQAVITRAATRMEATVWWRVMQASLGLAERKIDIEAKGWCESVATQPLAEWERLLLAGTSDRFGSEAPVGCPLLGSGPLAAFRSRAVGPGGAVRDVTSVACARSS